jgi:hypothetical protein
VRNQQDYILESMRGILIGTRSDNSAAAQQSEIPNELSLARSRGVTATAYLGDGGVHKYRGYREFWSFPMGSFRATDLNALRRLAQRAGEEFRGWPFLYCSQNAGDAPYAVEDGLDTAVKFEDFANQERADFWHLGFSGLFVQRTLMWEESAAVQLKTPAFLDVKELALYAAEGLRCMCSLYQDVVEPGTSVKVGLQITGARGRILGNTSSGSIPLSARYESKIDVIIYEQSRTLADWRSGLVANALEICEFVYQRFNWPDPNLGLARQAIERLLKRTL